LGDFIAQGDSLFTVNPIAVCFISYLLSNFRWIFVLIRQINSSIDVYSHNKRLSVVMSNERLGGMMYISIGATMVGSVVLTSQPRSFVQKYVSFDFVSLLFMSDLC
jgi:phosphatidylserine decarboxylase